MLVGYVDGSTELLTLPGLELTYSARHFQSPIHRLEFSASGKYLIIQRQAEVEVRLIKNGRLLSRHDATAFALSPTDNLLALGTETGELQLWDLNNNHLIYSQQAHSAEVYALAFSPDGVHLTSSGEDCFVRSWYTNSGKLSHFYQENSTNAYGEESTESRIFVYNLKYLEGTDHLLGFGSWSRIVNWNIVTGKTRYMIEPDPLEFYSGMVTLDPHFPGEVLVDDQLGVLTIGGMEFDLETGELLGSEKEHTDGFRECYQTGFSTLDGSVLLALGVGDRKGQLCFIDAERSELLEVLEIIPKDSAEHFWIKKMDLSPDGTHLLITLDEGIIVVVQVSE
jgi:WD40 repeat protein